MLHRDHATSLIFRASAACRVGGLRRLPPSYSGARRPLENRCSGGFRRRTRTFVRRTRTFMGRAGTRPDCRPVGKCRSHDVDRARPGGRGRGVGTAGAGDGRHRPWRRPWHRAFGGEARLDVTTSARPEPADGSGAMPLNCSRKRATSGRRAEELPDWAGAPGRIVLPCPSRISSARGMFPGRREGVGQSTVWNRSRLLSVTSCVPCAQTEATVLVAETAGLGCRRASTGAAEPFKGELDGTPKQARSP